ncbi:hypothetical protein P3102_26770 [Amycolatopsis sp. QT-25]|uniref:hypothetical protein n=1 Tax=Amycolatopsis sp. QT-25 TaxID=3034022 RepID=UPI0023ED1AA3|nr:hypothetical protein [Amycolatopsis sp. QT-25]WET77662.1 hypothetical protein P3102_26770 [Amycolatopsis sp. QT-25]
MTAQPRPFSRQRWLIPVIVVVVSLTVGVGLLARDLYTRPEAAPTEPVVDDSPTSVAPGAQPGSPTVEVTPDVFAHPQYQSARQVLQGYFDSINERDYPKWTSVVTRERAKTKTAAEWKKDYQSTRDGNILVYRIEPGAPSTLRVLVAFTSTQDVEDAPVYLPEACIRWRLVLPLRLESGSWRVDTTEGGTNPEHERC